MNKKWLISVGAIFIILSLVFVINNKNHSTLELKEGNIKKSNSNMVAINVSEDGINYTSQKDIPVGDYTLNTEKSKCRIPTQTLNGENAPIDESVTIEYTDGKLNFLGLTKNDTKCYVYFYKTPDTERPTISNVATTVTKTEINVTVTASDNKGVTEYWYQLDSGTPVKETSNTHTFTGLTAGQTYSLKVYVKDEAGNTSEVTTKSVTTTPNGQTSATILADIKARTDGSYKGTATPTFTSVATGAETAANNGIFVTDDPMYGTNAKTYYWRGAATTNHVIFANKCWRIIRINGDKSIRLIYNGTPSGSTCPGNGSNSNSIVLNGTVYNSSYNNNSFVGWTYTKGAQRPSTANPQISGTAAPLKTALESWYNNSISLVAKNKIVEGKFCNDRNTKNNETWRATGADQYYVAFARINDGTRTPTLACSNGDIYELNVGMITADEVQFAGASGETTNKSYYLYNGQYYWTMTPSCWEFDGAGVFIVRNDNGCLNSWGLNDSNIGVRPVINLKADTLFNEGSDGTSSNPYIVQ